MSSNPTTYLMLVDLAQGPYHSSWQVATGYQSAPGTLVVTNPVQFVFDLWERYADTGGVKLDLPIAPTAAVAKLYMTLAGSGLARTLVSSPSAVLAISAVSGVYQRVTLDIAANVFPTSFVCGTPTRLCIEIESSTGVVIATFFVDFQLVDAQGGYSEYPAFTSANEQVDVTVVTASATLTATPGPRTILVDPTAGDITITLPAATAQAPGQEITISALNLTNDITVALASGTFKGTTETDFTIVSVNEAHTLIAYRNATDASNDGWYHLNWLEVLT